MREFNMDVCVFDLPTLADGLGAVEQKYCELLNKYRSGEQLEVEVVDWMDTANTWLITTGE
jgi:hypothetical protein